MRLIKPIALFVALAVGLAAGAANTDLIGHWRFDEGSGTVAADSSGHGNGGTVSGVTWTTEGRSGGALKFEARGCVTTPDITIGPTFSIATWVKPYDVSAWDRIATNYFWEGFCLLIAPTGKHYLFIVANSPTREPVSLKCTGGLVAEGQWQHVVATYDGTTARLYVGGEIASPPEKMSPPPNKAFPIYIGAENSYDSKAWKGLIDDVLIFDHALDEAEVAQLYSLGGETSILDEPMFQRLTRALRDAEAIIGEQRHQEAIGFLEKKIAEYEQWREKNPDDIRFQYGQWFSDLYFLFAKAKEATGAPRQQVIGAYKRAVFSFKNGAAALTWLFTNTLEGQYASIVKTFVQNDTHKNIYVMRGFETNGNWPAFKRFLDVAFSVVANPVAYAELLEGSLNKNGVWMQEYLEYCRRKPQLTEYILASRCKIAEEHIARGNFKKAAEIYGDIIKVDDTSEHRRSELKFKIYECLFNEGEYKTVISGLDRFVAGNKAANTAFAERALLMKGQAYIQTGEISRASETFSDLLVQYPKTEFAPEAEFFFGYCYMLQGKFKEAAEALDLLVNDYPRSSYASKARLCLARIKNMTE